MNLRLQKNFNTSFSSEKTPTSTPLFQAKKTSTPHQIPDSSFSNKTKCYLTHTYNTFTSPMFYPNF